MVDLREREYEVSGIQGDEAKREERSGWVEGRNNIKDEDRYCTSDDMMWNDMEYVMLVAAAVGVAIVAGQFHQCLDDDGDNIGD